MTTSLVTGGAGFLGSHLSDRLLADGHRVICVDNLDTGTLANIAHIRVPEFSFVQHNMIEHLEIAEAVDEVFHLASPASPIDYLRLPLHTLKVGSYGTHNALGLAKRHRARFLLASTSEVYGDPQVHPQIESYWGHVNPIGPRGVYDESKRYAEALTMAYFRQQGVDTRIVRIFNTYGQRMRPNDGRAIPTFLRQALANMPLTVFGDGSQTRSFCFVSDLIDGLVRLMASDFHLPVNIGNPDEYTILELARAVLEATSSRSQIVFESLPIDDPMVRRPDVHSAASLLGWTPTGGPRRGACAHAGRLHARGCGPGVAADRPVHEPGSVTASDPCRVALTVALPTSAATSWSSRRSPARRADRPGTGGTSRLGARLPVAPRRRVQAPTRTRRSAPTTGAISPPRNGRPGSWPMAVPVRCAAAATARERFGLPSTAL